MFRLSATFAFAGLLFAQSVLPWGSAALCQAQQTLAPPAASAPSAPASVAGTPAQQRWLKATPHQRVLIAEEIGEEGVRQFARSKGWTPIFDGKEKGIAQGVDQVYGDAHGNIHAVEAKGGSSQPKSFHGHMQGTPEHAVEASKRILASPKASPAQKAGAKAVLEAAAQGTLMTHVVHTSHVLGEPSAAVLKQSLKTTPVASKLAKAAIGATKTLGTAAKVAGPVGFAVDAAFRVNDGVKTERRYREGAITEQQREVDHATNAAGMAGGWGGALGGFKLGGMGGAAVGTCVAPGPGTAVGATVGAVAGGTAGYFGGEAAAEAAAEWSVNKVHKTGTTVKGAAKSGWKKTRDAGSRIKGAAGRSWNWATDW